MQIIALMPDHWPAVKSIYESGIATRNTTFQTTAPAWDDWDKTLTPACRLVATNGDQVIGWAAITPVSGRCVYAGVGEVSVYIADGARGQGVGKALLAASEQSGFRTPVSSNFP
ncbi:GNAT family N-acetyltransferase [Chitinophaga pollutisoli]|uniref:GNAT family N-acetyltransferase n=1 Tax=Chitinophaga pollutisoli TaxID=3133966 RepID=A0ABZ2YPA0_9BACT